jgi:phospholipid N-methyltransferase
VTNDQRAGRPIGQAALTTGSFGSEPLRDSFEFLRGFLRHPARVGSVVPSSHRLEQRLVRGARVDQAHNVVELGPGTGGTTAALLRAMPAGARLLAIELDDQFQRLVGNSIADPRLVVQLGSAEHLVQLLAAHRMGPPDAIVSGIPFSTMPPEVSDRVAAAVALALRPGGRFVAYQVRSHVARFMAPYLGEPVTHWEMVNVPPVRVFSWTKPAAPRAARELRAATR